MLFLILALATSPAQADDDPISEASASVAYEYLQGKYGSEATISVDQCYLSSFGRSLSSSCSYTVTTQDESLSGTVSCTLGRANSCR